MEIETTTFGGRLRAARTLSGLTQEDVARRLDVPLRTYARWEAGLNEPRASRVPELADALGVSVGDLLGDPSNNKTPAPLSRPGA